MFCRYINTMKSGFFRAGVFFLIFFLLHMVYPAIAQKPSSKNKIKKKAEIEKVFPEFQQESKWLNTKPLTKDFFTDKVTLVYFWDYTSINCIREMKALKAWAEYYRPYRFQILWVHAPEFSSAADLKNLQRALERFGISGPVLADNEFKMWDALEIKSWPTKLLVNEKGKVFWRQGGEGEYYGMEAQIRSALKVLDGGSVLPPAVYTENLRAYNPDECGEMSAETYLGYKKSNWWGAKIGNKQFFGEDETRLFKDKGSRAERGFFLEGLWKNHEDYLEHARANETLSDYAGILYQAREVYVVASTAGASSGSRVYVTRDGEPVPPGYQGPDLQVDEKGETYFIPADPKLYYLVQGEDSELHELKLWTVSKNVRFYSFAFSNYCLTDFEHR